ncbi:amine sulfotransferase-like [Ixodes scapularis]|uniref:amine sulfotransferase-like n=1 Tax=Ixodes scapularis TaxID=6945 RepID=UPI0011617C07|nr:amine sulfotransferase-like [Ixodes scapularis]
MAVEVKVPNCPTYVYMDGVRVTNGYELDLFRGALKYQPEPDDKFVVSFPKTGTTWMQQIAYLLFHKGVPPTSAQDFHDNGPFLDIHGVETVKRRVKSGLIKTHLPYGIAPKSPLAKYLYICRNPKDTCISLFYHTCRFSEYEFQDGKLEDFFEVFLRGETDYGDYFDHVLSWYEHRDDPNVMFIHYEDVKTNPELWILKIAEFLDEKCHRLLINDRTILEHVLEYSGIHFMKGSAESIFENLYPEEVGRCSTDFIRKGIIGDWKHHLTTEMNARLEKKIYQKMQETDIITVWINHGLMEL